MAKRFISTNLFDDEWFSKLSKEGKLFFIYFITKCDHAGILRLNSELAEFQLKIKSIDTVIGELGNSLIRVKDGVYFMPKYLKFQYPDFPKSNVRQQDSAINLLKCFDLWDENLNSYLTVSKELANSYDNVHDTVIDIVPETIRDVFYSDFGKCNLNEDQIEPFKKLCERAKSLKIVQSLKEPITSFQLYELIKTHNKDIVFDVLEAMDNTVGLARKYVSAKKTANNWIKGRKK